MKQTSRINGEYFAEGMPAEFVGFGKGEVPLVIVPGLSDGLRSVGKTASALSVFYRRLTGLFRVFVVSRPLGIADGTTTRDMARYLDAFFDAVHIESAHIWGISQGGMISQWLAADFPHRVRSLCLAVTTPYSTGTMQQVIGRWKELACDENHADLVVDTCELTFSEKRLRRYRRWYPLLRRIGKPQDWHRFIVQAEACLSHDARAVLGRISAPTLVVGGGQDLIIGTGMSEMLAESISDTRLLLYPDLGHSAYDEAPACRKRIAEFFIDQESSLP